MAVSAPPDTAGDPVLLETLLQLRQWAGKRRFLGYLVDMAIDDLVSAMSDEAFWRVIESRRGRRESTVLRTPH